MDQGAQTSSKQVIPVTVDSIVRSLCEADAMINTPGARKVFAKALVVVPTYLSDIADVGEHLVKGLQALPADHPMRTKYDWEQVGRGIQAIRRGQVKVTVDKGLDKTSCEGPYALDFVE